MSVPRTTNKARPTKVSRDDVRYATFVQKRFNKRFPGTPEAFRLVDSTEQVVEALEEVVKTNRRLAVRSGGRCLCTGSELRPPGTAGEAASIPESNSAALAALARKAGAAVHVLPLVRDNAEAIEAGVAAALSVDVLVTLGGVSVGDYDFVRPALKRAGVTIDGWGVAIKPGKPIVLGRRGTTRVLGLPGNRASALVTFTLLGIPLRRAMQCDAHPLGAVLSASLSTPRMRSPDRLELARARLEMREGTLWA